MKMKLLKSALVFSVFAHAVVSYAISEQDYANQYQQKVVPFLKSGEQFTFKSSDGKLDLSAVRFVHPNEKGLIVVVNGQSEAWLKYGEIFFDLYQKGYTIYSYDHRGQGLSPHLALHNSQIGHVDHFIDYTLDLNEFIEKVVKPVHPDSKNLFLVAHSMGGGISTEYLELYPSPFQAVVLSAPMLQINTKPYPEPVAKAIVALSKTLGLGRRYALGKHDYDFSVPFEKNVITGSPARWDMTKSIYRDYPSTTIGGPSSGWVNESLRETRKIRKHIDQIDANVLMLQAENDQFVKNDAESDACDEMKTCKLQVFADSQHEILNEKDSIRDQALSLIDQFFSR